MSDEQKKESSLFFPALDTLRAIFCLTVVSYHVATNIMAHNVPGGGGDLNSGILGAGAFGVPFFFVLSAFLISHLLLEEQVRTRKVNVVAFYARRALRVWPVYFLVLVSSFLLVEKIAGRPIIWAWGPPFSFFIANLVMTSGALTAPTMSIAPLWSVSVEEQFYFLWPWVSKLVRPRGMLFVAVALIAAAPAFRDFRFQTGSTTHERHWYFTLTHMDSFGAGILACLVHRQGLGTNLKRHLGWVAVSALAIVVAVQVWTGTLTSQPSLSEAGVWLYTLVPLCGATVVFAAAQEAAGLHPFWKNPLALWLGKLSYGIYAFHGISIVLITDKASGAPLDVAWRAAATFAATIGMATCSYYLIERPLLRVKSRLQVVASGT